jgi:hypothetical protein
LMVPIYWWKRGFCSETAIHPPIVGVNVKNFMFAYTSHVTGPVQFDTKLSSNYFRCWFVLQNQSGTNVNVQPLINSNLYFNVNKSVNGKSP